VLFDKSALASKEAYDPPSVRLNITDTQIDLEAEKRKREELIAAQKPSGSGGGSVSGLSPTLYSSPVPDTSGEAPGLDAIPLPDQDFPISHIPAHRPAQRPPAAGGGSHTSSGGCRVVEDCPGGALVFEED